MAKPVVVAFAIILLITIGYVRSSTFLPGDNAQPFTLHTLSGTIQYTDPKNSSHLLPMVIFAYDPQSAYTQAVWTKDSSVKALIMNSTKNGNYIFMSYSDHALEDVQWMKKRLIHQIAHLHETG